MSDIEPSPQTSVVYDIREQIRTTRNVLYSTRGCWCGTKTVLFSHMLGPIIEHGSHIIYAPDEVFLMSAKKIYRKFRKRETAADGPKEGCLRSIIMGIRRFGINVVSVAKEYPVFVLIVVVSFALMKFCKTAILCFLQDTFLGWALWNQSLGPLGRLFSISAMMIARMVVSNLLPFTSPAFAYLIARSQPLGQGWAGSFYLLACSMPAGAIIPCLDSLAYAVVRRSRAYVETAGDDEDFEQYFIATNFVARITDNLPFSFWVRPFFMEPAYLAAKSANASDEGAASAAVLAGHFMIWAGPATTMYQRMFVPDWCTCIIIQPLGLLEDVAVVLATWAGESAESQKKAEISLYLFMLFMNVARFSVVRDRTRWVEHLVVMFLTMSAIVLRCFYDNMLIRVEEPHIVTTPPPVAANASGCVNEHSDIKVMIYTAAWVSILAVSFRVIARIIASCRDRDASSHEVSSPPPLD